MYNFKCIAYDAETDSLILTNNKKESYIIFNCPQRYIYFKSIDEADTWMKKHPAAHQAYMDSMYSDDLPF